MTTKRISYKFKTGEEYVSDQGIQLNYNAVFSPPSDMTNAQINDLLTCIGAEIKTENVPCSERAGTKARRVKVIRENSSSFQLYLPKRASIVTAAQCIWNAVKGTTFKPVCMELIGEQSSNLIDDLSTSAKGEITPGTIIKPPSAQGKHRIVFSGTMKEYKTDATFGATILMPFVSQTNRADNQSYEDLETEIDACVGELTQVQACGGASNARNYRRYVASIYTGNVTPEGQPGAGDVTDEDIQTVTVPQADNTDANIKACGTALANATSVICLAYYGESNNRLHKLLTQ